jgi:hypothetical protein
VGGVRHASFWYSMTLEPEGSFWIVGYMTCPCYDGGHMGWGSNSRRPLYYMVCYIT